MLEASRVRASTNSGKKISRTNESSRVCVHIGRRLVVACLKEHVVYGTCDCFARAFEFLRSRSTTQHAPRVHDDAAAAGVHRDRRPCAIEQRLLLLVQPGQDPPARYRARPPTTDLAGIAALAAAASPKQREAGRTAVWQGRLESLLKDRSKSHAAIVGALPQPVRVDPGGGRLSDTSKFVCTRRFPLGLFVAVC